MKVVLFLLVLWTQIPALQAQTTITSSGSGDWSQPSSWDRNRIPADNDIIVIQSRHVMTMSQPVALRNITLRVIGELSLADGKSLNLNSASVVNVISGGRISAKKQSDQSAIILGGAAKFRGGKVFNASWGPGILIGLAYATSTTGNIDQYGSGFIIGNLPSVWQDLKLYLTPDRHVQMVWVTSHETAARTFRIERSQQGQVWDIIGTIESAGNMSSQNIYNFVDNNPGYGLVYYRVRELDPDGVAKLSSVRSLRLDDVLEERLYPNPTRGAVRLSHKKVEGSSQLAVYNLQGQLVYSQVLPKGSISQALDLEKFSAGVYTLQVIHDDGSTSHHRLVKY
ncbi:MAG: T9SS type A sorting domain-containing protein [Chitinophagaceae bacterium]|nr:T9SS type A sorting domain-containing protein [Chitinophagaceae bacterium]